MALMGKKTWKMISRTKLYRETLHRNDIMASPPEKSS
jgi:hypothetical protein